MWKFGIYERYIKRFQDVLCASIAAILLSPLFLVIALLVKIKLGSPVIFKQMRPGHNETIFTLYKFRTMTNKKDNRGKLLSDENRLTTFGKLLRSSSLDELPELFNILKGDMAVVGPRPQLIRDLVFMTDEQRKRHSVRPGLTGLAQVNGRNAILWESKLQYDLAYIKNITFVKDWKIIGKTMLYVVQKKDVSTIGLATSEDLGDYLLRTGQISEKTYIGKIKEANKYIYL